MKSLIGLTIAGAVVATSWVPVSAMADDGSWLVRGRAVRMQNDNKNADNLLPAEVTASDKWLPDLDISYFFTENIALEVVLTVPQEHDIKLGETNIGTVTQLPPHFMLQYHWPMGSFKPYVGLGLNYTRIWDVNLTVPGVDVERSSVGPSFQLGMDYKVAPQWYLNVDVKKTLIGIDVTAGGSKVDELNIDPWLMSVGIGYRF